MIRDATNQPTKKPCGSQFCQYDESVHFGSPCCILLLFLAISLDVGTLSHSPDVAKNATNHATSAELVGVVRVQARQIVKSVPTVTEPDN